MLAVQGFAQVSANFTTTKSHGCSPLLVTLNDSSSSNHSITSYNWFVSGPSYSFQSTANLDQITLPLVNPGQYSIHLIVCDSLSICDTILKVNHVEVYDFPDLDLNLSSDTACVPHTVCIENLSVVNCDSLTSCIIDMGDGTVYNSSTNSNCQPCHTYTMPGNYNITIVQSNSCGCTSDTSYLSAFVLSSSPNADFTAIPNVLCETNDSIQLVANSTGSGMLSHYFYLNDDLVSENPTPFINPDPGVHDISLIVMNEFNCSDTLVKANYIEVNDTEVQLNLSDTLLCPNDSLSLFVLLQSPADSVVWSISGPESITAVGDSLMVVPTMSGVYSVSLVTFFQSSCTDSIMLLKAFRVTDVLKTSISVSDSVGCHIPDNITFKSSVLYPQMLWSFAGGTPQSTLDSQSVSVLYNAYGSYSATLSVVDSNGCMLEYSESDIVQFGKLQIGIATDKAGGCVPETIQFSPVLSLADSIVSIAWDFDSDGVVDDLNTYPSFTFTDTGCYTVSLIVEIASGCQDTLILKDLICIGNSGTVNIIGSPTVVCYDDMENCIDISGHADSVFVDFGDGFSYMGPPGSICHTYTSLDTFFPFVIPFYNQCAADTLTLLNPFVILGPRALFRDSANCSLSVHFINESQDYDSLFWDFGDLSVTDDTSYRIDPIWTYSQAGIYNVVLYTYDSAGFCSDVFQNQIEIIDPTADFVADTTSGCAPFTTVFHNTSPALNPWTFTWWDFNGVIDGLNIFQGWGPANPQFTFTEAGSYDVAMRFKNGQCDDTLIIEDYISVYGSKVEVAADQTSGCKPLKVTFSSDSTVNFFSSIIEYKWFFGDGDSSSLANPTHIYDQGGVYTVILSVKDSFGCISSDSLVNFISVNSPEAEFLLSDSILCIGQYSFITNLTNPMGNQFEWYYDDSLINTSNSSFILPETSEEGEFNVRMIVTDQDFCSDTLNRTLIVDEPEAGFYTDASFAACPPLINNFMDTSLGYIDHWLWTFSNGVTSQTQNPSLVFTEVGGFEVGLVVTSVSGCRDTAQTDSVFVDGPTANVSLKRVGVDCPCVTYEFIIESFNTQSASILPGNGSVISFTPSHNGNMLFPAVDTLRMNLCDLGVFYPLLSLNDLNGCNRVISIVDSLALDTPVAAFDRTAVDFCDSGAICFSDASTFEITGFETVGIGWQIDTGIIDSIPFFCYPITKPGSIPISLTVSNTIGCKNTYSDTIYVPKSPNAKIHVSDSVICLNETIQIYTEAHKEVSIMWMVHDSMYYDSILHIEFSQPGHHEIGLILMNASNCVDTMTKTVMVVVPPTISMSKDTSICFGDSMQLYVSGGDTSYWFQSSSVYYESPGEVYVAPDDTEYFIAFIEDSNSCISSDTALVSVNYVDASFSYYNVCTNSATGFVDGSDPPTEIATWLWDFGDSSTSVVKNPMHQYNAMATYNVHLTVTDSLGCSDTATSLINTLTATTAQFSV
ncbi:MAG: PKD domain-containing protein, partial [Bacteroidia bacterium]|nr:PKD domain-containing protein [Bacteroidia bacterium]